MVSTLYCQVEVLCSIPGQDKIYMENSVSAAHPGHSAVTSRPGLYLVEGEAVTGHHPVNTGSWNIRSLTLSTPVGTEPMNAPLPFTFFSPWQQHPLSILP